MTPHEYGKWTRAYHIERGAIPVWLLGHITPKGPYCFHWHQDGHEVSMRAIERTMDKWLGSSPDKHRNFYGPYETKEYKVADLKQKKEWETYKEKLKQSFLEVGIDCEPVSLRYDDK